ncbi:hypothetical protein E1A91_A02G106800v1 [Gossypium mustelinum]|uniref:Uncharacterized protein n=1 Tax=Gossypium mustelinum TaxID=34275 RepID=A0A5D3A9I0_GOSMU|nr:hypothetical protein E1A91_A02G106800v1 [Gossypium mustelinum]
MRGLLNPYPLIWPFLTFFNHLMCCLVRRSSHKRAFKESPPTVRFQKLNSSGTITAWRHAFASVVVASVIKGLW